MERTKDRMNDDSTEGRVGRVSEMAWRKSSFSSAGECLVVAKVGRDIALRNSNNPEAGTLLLKRRGLAGWISGVKAGEFDDLAV